MPGEAREEEQVQSTLDSTAFPPEDNFTGPEDDSQAGQPGDGEAQELSSSYASAEDSSTSPREASLTGNRARAAPTVWPNVVMPREPAPVHMGGSSSHKKRPKAERRGAAAGIASELSQLTSVLADALAANRRMTDMMLEQRAREREEAEARAARAEAAALEKAAHDRQAMLEIAQKDREHQLKMAQACRQM